MEGEHASSQQLRTDPQTGGWMVAVPSDRDLRDRISVSSGGLVAGARTGGHFFFEWYNNRPVASHAATINTRIRKNPMATSPSGTERYKEWAVVQRH